MSELWIPITGIICVALVVVTTLLLSAQEKKKLHKTLQKHLDNGGKLTQGLLQQLGVNIDQRKRDIRKGLMLTSIGLACFASGLIGGNLILGSIVGVFPLFVGLAFCILVLLCKDE